MTAVLRAGQKGLGVFASRKFAAGEHVPSEHWSFVNHSCAANAAWKPETSEAGIWDFDFGCFRLFRIFTLGLWILDIGKHRWTLGFWIWDFLILDFGFCFWSFEFGVWIFEFWILDLGILVFFLDRYARGGGSKVPISYFKYLMLKPCSPNRNSDRGTSSDCHRRRDHMGLSGAVPCLSCLHVRSTQQSFKTSGKSEETLLDLLHFFYIFCS